MIGKEKKKAIRLRGSKLSKCILKVSWKRIGKLVGGRRESKIIIKIMSLF